MSYVIFWGVVILSHGFISYSTCTYTHFAIYTFWGGEYTAFYLEERRSGWRHCNKSTLCTLLCHDAHVSPVPSCFWNKLYCWIAAIWIFDLPAPVPAPSSSVLSSVPFSFCIPFVQPGAPSWTDKQLTVCVCTYNNNNNSCWNRCLVHSTRAATIGRCLLSVINKADASVLNLFSYVH